MTIGTVLSSLLAIILSLAFVAGLAFGVLWLIKRFQDGSFGKLTGEGSGKTLRFERALPVGQRERLVIVEVDGEHMLLGVTAHSITQLKSWPRGELESDEVTDLELDEEQSAGSDLSDKARRFKLRMARGTQQ